jgi:hypothetical protein
LEAEVLVWLEGVGLECEAKGKLHCIELCFCFFLGKAKVTFDGCGVSVTVAKSAVETSCGV